MSGKQDVIMLIEKDLNEYRGKMYKCTGNLKAKAGVTKKYAEGLYGFLKDELANGADTTNEQALPLNSVSPSYDRDDLQEAFNAGGIGESWENWIEDYDSPI